MNLVPRFKELQPLRALVNVGATMHGSMGGHLRPGRSTACHGNQNKLLLIPKTLTFGILWVRNHGDFRTNPMDLFGGGRLKQTNFKNLSLGNRWIRKSLGPF